MNQFFLSKHLISGLFLLLNTLMLSAQWNNNTSLNTEVSLATGDKFSPAIVSDDSGGAIIVWRDSRNGNYDIYAQRIDINGVPVWQTNGIAISTLTTKQQSPVIASDGKGGAIIVWDDFGQLSAQRVNARGVIQWKANGVPVTLNPGVKYFPQVVSDDSGGVIITWEDSRGSSRDVYAQRLNGNGTPQWGFHGMDICTASGNQQKPQLIADGNGGAIITWKDVRAGNEDIYAQRVNHQGQVLWQTDGEIVCNANRDQFFPDITTDDSGGAIIVWSDERNGIDDIYAQRINGNGNAVWKSNGVVICDAYDIQLQPTLSADGFGGAIIAWGDYRLGAILNFDIYAQKINAAGNVQWTNNGIEISAAANRQFDQRIIGDGRGGAMIVWEDYRNSIDVYGQHVTTTGQILWKKDGMALSDATASQFIPEICDDGNGGMIITWHDNRNTRTDIYAQNVCYNGVTGYTSSRGPVNTTSLQNLKICKGNYTKLSVIGTGDIGWYNKDTGGVFLGAGPELVTPRLESTQTFYVQDSNECGAVHKRTAIKVMVGQPSDNVLVKTVCKAFSWQNKIFNVSGKYYDTVLNAGGCDSFITLDLTVSNIDTAVIVVNNTLQAKELDASYQWIDCVTQQWLTNDTSRSFTAKKNGSYAVIVKKNSCEDTSHCYTFKHFSGINETIEKMFSFYPNPVDNWLYLNIEPGIELAKLVIFDVSGRAVLDQSFNHNGTNAVDLYELQNGIYFMQLSLNGHSFNSKIVVQH